jgi:hypothetical protein
MDLYCAEINHSTNSAFVPGHLYLQHHPSHVLSKADDLYVLENAILRNLNSIIKLERWFIQSRGCFIEEC